MSHKKQASVYPAQFKAQAVKLVLEQNLTIKEASERLNMPLKTLSAWFIRARTGALPASEVSHQAEINRLKKALALA